MYNLKYKKSLTFNPYVLKAQNSNAHLKLINFIEIKTKQQIPKIKSC